MFKDKKAIFKAVLTVFVSVMFIQSLSFKFTGSPETDHIFMTLNDWAAGFGFEGLFIAPGIFNAYVVGSAELFAAVLLLSGLFLKYRLLTAFGALVSLGVISGAVFFHLFTPLGIVVMDDGGSLFGMAVAIWISSAILLYTHKEMILNILKSK